MKKRLLSILLAFALTVPIAVVPINSSAAEVTYPSIGADFRDEWSSGSSVTVDENAVKTCREKLCNHVRSFVISVTMFGDLSGEYLAEYAQSLIEQAMEHTGDPTEGDYLKFQYGSWQVQMSSVGSGLYSNVQFTYSVNYFTNKDQEAAVTEKVNEIIASLKLDGKNDYEKVCAIYSYLCDNVVYDYDAYEKEKGISDASLVNGVPHSAYAALCNGKAVCQGYANALYRLLLTAGVDCRIISGSGQGEPHAWNIVKLGGKYYNVDSTWDSGRTSYAYFLSGSLHFKQHYANPEFRTTEFKLAYPISESSYDVNLSDIDSDTDTETNSDVTSDTDTETNSDVTSDIDTDTETNSDVTSDIDTDTDTNSDVTSDIDTETNSDVTSDIDTETNSDVTSDIDTDTETNSDVTSDIDTDTDTNSDVTSDIDTETNSDVTSDIDTDTETNSDITSDTDTETNSDITSDTDTETNSDITSDTDTDNTTDSDAASDTDTEKSTDTDNKKFELAIIGDMDNDQKITSADSLSVLRISVKLDRHTHAKELGDVNNDGKVDSYDALEILRYSVHLPSLTNIGQKRYLETE